MAKAHKYVFDISCLFAAKNVLFEMNKTICFL